MIGESRRLAAVQTPVIPVVSRWIAETPGTISLGQGVVSYGPPPEAIDGGTRVWWSGRRPPLRTGRRAAGSRRRARREARARERDRGPSGEPRRRHGRRQPGVHERGARDHRSRRRDHPAGAVLLQSRDGDRDGRRASGAGADDGGVSNSIWTRLPGRSHRGRARSSPCRQTTRPAPCIRSRRCAR